MKSLVRTLILVSALSLWAGAALAKATNQLHCSETHCSYNEEIGPSGTKSYQGYCDGTGNTQVTIHNSSMTCHKAKGLTCTVAAFIEGNDEHPYWSCTCTNWNATKEAHPDIDLSCPSPS